MPIVDVRGVGPVDFDDSLSPDQIEAAIELNFPKSPDASQISRRRRGLPTKQDILGELSGPAADQFQREQEAELARQDEPSLVSRAVQGWTKYATAPFANQLDVASRLIPGAMGEYVQGAADVMRDPGTVADRGAKLMAAEAIRQVRAPAAILGQFIPGAGGKNMRDVSRDLGDFEWALEMNPETGTSRTVSELAGNPSIPALAADVASMGVEGVARNVPQLVAGGGVVGFLTKAGMSTAMATRLAPFIVTAPQETASALEEYARDGQTTPYSKAAAVGVGAINGLFEMVGDSKILRRLMPDTGDVIRPTEDQVRWAVKEALKQSGIESVTETAQEGTTMAGGALSGAREYAAGDVADRLATAGLGGAMTGAGMSAAVSIANTPRNIQAENFLLAEQPLRQQMEEWAGRSVPIGTSAAHRQTVGSPPISTTRPATPKNFSAAEADDSATLPSTFGTLTPVDLFIREVEGMRPPERPAEASPVDRAVEESLDAAEQLRPFPRDPNQFPAPTITRIEQGPEPSIMSEWDVMRQEARGGDQNEGKQEAQGQEPVRRQEEGVLTPVVTDTRAGGDVLPAGPSAIAEAEPAPAKPKRARKPRKSGISPVAPEPRVEAAPPDPAPPEEEAPTKPAADPASDASADQYLASTVDHTVLDDRQGRITIGGDVEEDIGPGPVFSLRPDDGDAYPMESSLRKIRRLVKVAGRDPNASRAKARVRVVLLDRDTGKRWVVPVHSTQTGGLQTEKPDDIQTEAERERRGENRAGINLVNLLKKRSKSGGFRFQVEDGWAVAITPAAQNDTAEEQAAVEPTKKAKTSKSILGLDVAQGDALARAIGRFGVGERRRSTASVPTVPFGNMANIGGGAVDASSASETGIEPESDEVENTVPTGDSGPEDLQARNRLRLMVGRMATEAQGKASRYLNPEEFFGVVQQAATRLAGTLGIRNPIDYLIRFYPEFMGDATRDIAIPPGSSKQGAVAFATEAVWRKASDELYRQYRAGDLWDESERDGEWFFSPDGWGTVDTSTDQGSGFPTGERNLVQDLTRGMAAATRGSFARRVLEAVIPRLGGVRYVVLNDIQFENLLTSPDHRGRIAFYSPSTHTIYTRQRVPPGGKTALHEAVHAATIQAMVKDPQFAAELIGLMSEARQAIGMDDYGTKDHGNDAMSAAEFIAEALSNPEFQAKLRQSIPGKASIWTRFVDFVRRILGLPARDIPLLERLLSAIHNTKVTGGASSVAGTFAAPTQFRSLDQTTGALNRPDVGQRQQDRIMVEAGAQAAVVSQALLQSIQQRVATLMTPQSAGGTTHQRRIGRRLNNLTQWVEAQAGAAGMLPGGPGMAYSLATATPASDEELDAVQEASVGVLRLREDIYKQHAKNEEEIERLEDELNDFVTNELPILRGERAKAAYLEHAGRSTLDAYDEYLEALKARGPSITDAERIELERAARVVPGAKKETRLTAKLQDALELLATRMPQAQLASVSTGSELAKAVAIGGYLTDAAAQAAGISRDMADMLAWPTGTGALSTMPNAIGRLTKIRILSNQSTALDQSIDGFEAWWNQVQKAGVGKPKRVTLRQAVSAMIKFDRQRQDTLDSIREMSARFDELDANLRARVEYRNILADLTTTPEYNSQVGAAARWVDALLIPESGQKAEFFGKQDQAQPRSREYVVGGQRFNVTWGVEPGLEDGNIQVVGQMLQAIEAELARTDLDPVVRRSYQNLQHRADLYLRIAGANESFGTVRPGVFDLISGVRSAFPMLDVMRDRDGVTRLLPGRMKNDLLMIQSAVNAAALGLRGVAQHAVHGQKAIALAIRRAIASHPGITQDEWYWDILEGGVLATNQDSKTRNLEAGDTSPEGRKITSEDVRAARLMAEYRSHIMRVISGRGVQSAALSANPTMVEEGGMMRQGVKSGRFTTARRLIRGRPEDATTTDYLARLWTAASESNDPAVRRAARVALMDDTVFFRRVPFAYVWEKNGEFHKADAIARDANQLSADWSNGVTARASSWEQLIDQLEQINTTRSALDGAMPLAREQIEDALIAGIDGVFHSYRSVTERADQIDQANLSQAERDGLANRDTLVSMIDTQSSFTTERGKMFAPSSFYQYGMPTDQSMNSTLAEAIAPLRRRELDLMDATLDALVRYRDQLLREVAQNPARRGELRRRAVAGQEFANLNHLSNIIRWFESAAKIYRENQEQTSKAHSDPTLWDSFKNVDKALLLASPTAAFSNAFSAVMLGVATPLNLIGMRARAARELATAPARNFVKMVLYGFAPTRLGRWARANRGTLYRGFNHIAGSMQRMAQLYANAVETGIVGRRDTLATQTATAQELGSMGGKSPILPPGSNPNTWTRRISEMFSRYGAVSYPALAAMQMSSLADEFGNALNLDYAERTLRLYFAALYRAMDARSRGPAGWDDMSNPRNAITVDELGVLGMQPEDIAVARDLLLPAGGLERAALDYWRRASAVRPEDRAAVPLFATEGMDMDVKRSILGLTNLSLDSNRPNTSKNSAIGRVIESLFTFVGWITRWLSVVSMSMMRSSRRGLTSSIAHGMIATLVTLMFLALQGWPIPMVRNMITSTVMNREPSTISAADLARDPTASTAAKVFGTAVASSLPYFGEYIADALGAQTYRAAATDITRMSRTISMVSSLASALEYGAKTGDFAGSMTQTLRAVAPIGSPIYNRMPGAEARNAIADAVRAAKVAAGPLEVQPMRGGGGGGEITRFSSLVRRAVAAEANGDTRGAMGFLEQASALKAAEGVRNPRSAIVSALAGQAPERKAFGRKLEESERSGLMSRMSKQSRAAYTRADLAVARLRTAMRAPAKARKSSSLIAKPRALKAPKLKAPKLPKMRMIGMSPRQRRPTGLAPAL